VRAFHPLLLLPSSTANQTRANQTTRKTGGGGTGTLSHGYPYIKCDNCDNCDNCSNAVIQPNKFRAVFHLIKHRHAQCAVQDDLLDQAGDTEIHAHAEEDEKHTNLFLLHYRISAVLYKDIDALRCYGLFVALEGTSPTTAPVVVLKERRDVRIDGFTND